MVDRSDCRHTGASNTSLAVTNSGDVTNRSRINSHIDIQSVVGTVSTCGVGDLIDHWIIS